MPMVAAAIAKARQLSIIVNVAVCDNQGHLIAFNRMDKAYAEAAAEWMADSTREQIGKLEKHLQGFRYRSVIQ